MEQAVRALRLVRDEVSNSRKQSEEQHTRLQVVQAEKVALEEAVRKLQHQLQRVSHKLVQDLPKLQQQLKCRRVAYAIMDEAAQSIEAETMRRLRSAPAQFDTQHLANTAWAFATLAVEDSELLDAVLLPAALEL